MKTLITTASEYDMKKVDAIQLGLELNQTHSLMSSDINLLSQHKCYTEKQRNFSAV
jgi:hypothetical protein